MRLEPTRMLKMQSLPGTTPTPARSLGGYPIRARRSAIFRCPRPAAIWRRCFRRWNSRTTAVRFPSSSCIRMRSTDLRGPLLRRTHPSIVLNKEARSSFLTKRRRQEPSGAATRLYLSLALGIATCPCRDPETVAEGEQLLAHRYRRCTDCRDDGRRSPGDKPRRDKRLSTGPLESQWDAGRLWPCPVARCTPRQFASAYRCYRKWTSDTGCRCLVPDGSIAWDRARPRRRLEEVVHR